VNAPLIGSEKPLLAADHAVTGRLTRTMRRMIGPGHPSGPAERMPRQARWAAFVLLIVFASIGFTQHSIDSIGLSLLAFALTVGAGVLLLGPHQPVLIPAAIATAGIALLGDGTSSNVGWFGVCVLAGWCVLAGGRLVGIVFWIATLALFGGEWIWAQTDPGWGTWMAGSTFTVAAALLVRHELDLVARLREAQAGLADQARVEERNRIARELHDVIAHALIVSQLHVSSARLAVENDPADAARALAEAERLGRESLAEVRRAVGLLREEADGGTAPPLPGATDVPALVERFRSAGMDVTLSVDGDAASAPATTGLAVYRILQEAMTNAVKHAPGWPVSIELSIESARVCLVVESGGVPGWGDGLGVMNMRERAASVGGTCSAGPGGAGWVVRAELPA
jgi:signal transduction histidine kinase